MDKMDLAHDGARKNYPDSEESGFGMSDDEMIRRMRGLVRLEIAKHKLLGLPIARYDRTTKQAYIEYADGSREYVT